MSNASFIKNETPSQIQGVLSLNWRLFRSLPLFLKLLPLSTLAILFASISPSVFRWYSGQLSNSTEPLRISKLGLSIPFTISGLVMISVFAIFFRIAAWALFEMSAMWSTQRIHLHMARSMAETRTTFYDENPSGRILNRLIRDFDELRLTAIIFAGDFLNASIEIFTVGIMASFASPWAGLMIFPLLGSFAYFQKTRSGMLDQTRTSVAIATGQILNRKNDLVEGREIFLLYGKGEKLLEQLGQSYRKYIQMSALSMQIETWGSFWIRISSEVFAFGVLLFLAGALAGGHIDVPLSGVIISSLFGMTGTMAWLEFATSMISRSTPHVRRVFEYVDLPHEEREERSPSLIQISETPTKKEDSSQSLLPLTDDIIFDHYSMSYRKDFPLILSDLQLRIPLGLKTALIGRTGSGKTSIVQALMRMVYVHQGDIRIGNQSIFDVELKSYRKQFGVVPQMPYLFSGTIQSNLDRTGYLSKDKLEQALETVRLPYRLDYPILEGGQNLSQGERQLVCLARVIAADRQIILMDEPTSGLDPLTDARINRILETSLKNRTVITIAHRKESLDKYDTMIEMKAGQAIVLRTSK